MPARNRCIDFILWKKALISGDKLIHNYPQESKPLNPFKAGQKPEKFLA
jgi:hypothetical protein